MGLPCEVLHRIFVFSHDWRAWNLTCRYFNSISRDPIAQARYLVENECESEEPLVFIILRKYRMLLVPETIDILCETAGMNIPCQIIQHLAVEGIDLPSPLVDRILIIARNQTTVAQFKKNTAWQLMDESMLDSFMFQRLVENEPSNVEAQLRYLVEEKKYFPTIGPFEERNTEPLWWVCEVITIDVDLFIHICRSEVSVRNQMRKYPRYLMYHVLSVVHRTSLLKAFRFVVEVLGVQPILNDFYNMFRGIQYNILDYDFRESENLVPLISQLLSISPLMSRDINSDLMSRIDNVCPLTGSQSNTTPILDGTKNMEHWNHLMAHAFLQSLQLTKEGYIDDSWEEHWHFAVAVDKVMKFNERFLIASLLVCTSCESPLIHGSPLDPLDSDIRENPLPFPFHVDIENLLHYSELIHTRQKWQDIIGAKNILHKTVEIHEVLVWHRPFHEWVVARFGLQHWFTRFVFTDVILSVSKSPDWENSMRNADVYVREIQRHFETQLLGNEKVIEPVFLFDDFALQNLLSHANTIVTETLLAKWLPLALGENLCNFKASTNLEKYRRFIWNSVSYFRKNNRGHIRAKSEPIPYL